MPLNPFDVRVFSRFFGLNQDKKLFLRGTGVPYAISHPPTQTIAKKPGNFENGEGDRPFFGRSDPPDVHL
jgi:hypothetical protein